MGGRSSGGCWFRSSTIWGLVVFMRCPEPLWSSVHQGMRRPKSEEKPAHCTHVAHSHPPPPPPSRVIMLSSSLLALL